jgi:hypothetical protein
MDKKHNILAMYCGKLASVRIRGAGSFEKDKVQHLTVTEGELGLLKREDMVIYSGIACDGKSLTSNVIWHGPNEQKKKEEVKVVEKVQAPKPAGR